MNNHPGPAAPRTVNAAQGVQPAAGSPANAGPPPAATPGARPLSPRSLTAIAALIPASPPGAERLLANAGLTAVPGRTIPQAELRAAAGEANLSLETPAGLAILVLMGLTTVRRGQGMVRDTLASLDTSQPAELAAALDLAGRAAEYYAAGRRPDQRRLLELRDALAADGYVFDPATRTVAAPVTVLAAGPALRTLDAAGTPAAIRAAASRLAAAVVDDPYW